MILRCELMQCFTLSLFSDLKTLFFSFKREYVKSNQGLLLEKYSIVLASTMFSTKKCVYTLHGCQCPSHESPCIHPIWFCCNSPSVPHGCCWTSASQCRTQLAAYLSWVCSQAVFILYTVLLYSVML